MKYDLFGGFPCLTFPNPHILQVYTTLLTLGRLRRKSYQESIEGPRLHTEADSAKMSASTSFLYSKWDMTDNLSHQSSSRDSG